MADLAIAGFDTATDTRCQCADGYPHEPTGTGSSEARCGDSLRRTRECPRAQFDGAEDDRTESRPDGGFPTSAGAGRPIVLAPSAVLGLGLGRGGVK